ncbi:MAG: hypothetical protein ACKVIQ_01385 [Acidimicrobiales bacterium]
MSGLVTPPKEVHDPEGIDIEFVRVGHDAIINAEVSELAKFAGSTLPRRASRA